MKRFKSILCTSLLTIALSSSALAGDISVGKSVAGDISVGKSVAGDISVGKSVAGDISVGKAAANSNDSTYIDFVGYLLMIFSSM